MIAHFAPLGLKITEVPISVTYDVPHKHKLNPVSHGFGVLARIVGLIGYKRPLLSFGIPGLLVTLFGIGAEVYTFSDVLPYRSVPLHRLYGRVCGADSRVDARDVGVDLELAGDDYEGQFRL